MPAKELGLRGLKVCRRKMIEMDWSRTRTNSQVDHIRRLGRWAAEEELLPASISRNLHAMASRGKTAPRETEQIKPAS